MSGTEALIQQMPRSKAIANHIQLFIKKIENAADLSSQDKSDLKNSLGQMKRESIRQAGKILVGKKLSSFSYANIPATEFFGKCYTLRSKLVHGSNQLPSREEVDQAAAQLEAMLSDLLSYDILDDVGPR